MKKLSIHHLAFVIAGLVAGLVFVSEGTNLFAKENRLWNCHWDWNRSRFPLIIP